MYSEILDDDSESKVVQTKFVWKPRVVLAILWAFVIWRFLDGNYLGFKFIWGAVGLSVATYYLVINSSISIYATLTLLLLGFFNIVNHKISGSYLVLGEFIINYYYFWLIILHIILNFNKVFGVKENKFKKK